MPKARLLFRRKRRYDDGGILEMTIWQVPRPVLGSRHGLKYSLYYGKNGERLVGYDNERGKGDHRRWKDQEETYAFVSVEKLVADFLADVGELPGGDL